MDFFFWTFALIWIGAVIWATKPYWHDDTKK